MDTREQDVQQRWCALFIVLAIAVNWSGLCIPILGPDAAVYASIAKTMVQQHNYLELFVHGHDWLDTRLGKLLLSPRRTAKIHR